MRFNPAAVVALAAALMVSTVAKADVVFGNLGDANQQGLISSNTEFVSGNQGAVGFTVPAGQPWSLTEVVVGLAAPDGPVDVTATLFSASGTTPGSALSWSDTQTVSSSARDKYTFQDVPTSLAPGNYFLVISGNNEFNMFASAAGVNTPPTGQNSSGWTAFTGWLANTGAGWDANLMPAGTAISVVPEPSTYALAGVGIVAAGLLRRYRKSRRAAV